MDGEVEHGLKPTGTVAVAGEVRIRVRYSECDPMGVAHHSAYLVWFEEGRTELLRPSGVSYQQLEEMGILLAVTKLEVRYRAPARYDDELLLRTQITGGGRARIDHAYELLGTDGAGKATATLATGTSTIACLNQEGRPRPLPEWLVPA